MKVIYKMPMLTELRDAIRQAQENNQVIHYIELTEDEWKRLAREAQPYLLFPEDIVGPVKFFGVEVRKGAA